MKDNVLKFPTVGKAVTLDDQGVYFTMNPNTATVHSIFRLDFEGEWYLHQLQKTDINDEYGWILMADHAGDTLKKMPTHEMSDHFSKPEFSEPKGVWQILRNNRFGFGKFTPINNQEIERCALFAFSGNKMHMPILIVKADERSLHQAESSLGHRVEFA